MSVGKTVKKPSGCTIGCAAFLWLMVVLSIIGACSRGDEAPVQDDGPRFTEPLRDPGYPGSLCEGSDYLYYDDCL